MGKFEIQPRKNIFDGILINVYDTSTAKIDDLERHRERTMLRMNILCKFSNITFNTFTSGDVEVL